MSNSIKSLFIFALGAAAGSLVTWQLIKDKYEQLYQEEVKSYKDTFGKKFTPKKFEPKEFKPEETPKNDISEPEKKETAEVHIEKDPLMENLRKVVNQAGYTDYSNINNPKPKEEPEPEVDEDTPYVISPEELGDQIGYDAISINYYADGVVADDSDEIMEDVENTLGIDFSNHFGEYDNDVVCVRNPRLKIDYEICRDNRTYVAVVGEEPHRMR